MKTRTVSLPADSAFAVSTLKKQEADRAEQAALKQLVLDSLSTDGGGNTPLVPAPGRKGKITLWSNSANHRIG